MNANDLIKMVANMSEEQRRGVVIASMWEVSNVEQEMEDQGISPDEFTFDEKVEILEKACDGDGDTTDAEIGYRIQDAVEDLHDLKVGEDGVEDDLDRQIEVLDGLGLDDTQYEYYREALNALHSPGCGDSHGYASAADVLRDARKSSEE